MKKLLLIMMLLAAYNGVSIGQATGQATGQPIVQLDDRSRISVLEYQIRELDVLKAENSSLRLQLEQRNEGAFKQLEERLENRLALKSDLIARDRGIVDWMFGVIAIVLGLAAISFFVFFNKQFIEINKLKKEAQAKLNDIELTRKSYEGLLKLSPNIDLLNSNPFNNEELQTQIESIINNPNSSEFEKAYAATMQLLNEKILDSCIEAFKTLLSEYSHQINVELRSNIYFYMSFCYLSTKKIAMALSYAEASVYLIPENNPADIISLEVHKHNKNYEKSIIISNKLLEIDPQSDDFMTVKGKALLQQGNIKQNEKKTLEALKLYKEALDSLEKSFSISKDEDLNKYIKILNDRISKCEAQMAATKAVLKLRTENK